ncbi:Dockerin type I repeat protein [Rubripirellula tenax]|uniref:Dockerin type I repeat protein n=1 Tax=Rubripirellula tenax TaxID=2528015 RepID=A0A5C6FAI1_9BACT|nr:GEVED domain-containing protein [Rubripirellula tenax]TWU58783.1 Dockerin type I repeat protein [Rubripirellula tenax]
MPRTFRRLRRFESLESRRMLTTIASAVGEGESTANAQPSFVIAGPALINEDAPLQSIANFASDFNPGPGEGDESTASRVLHDEGADGIVDPLSTDSSAPTNLGLLSIGSNIVRGTVESANSIGNVDVFTFQVEAGFQLNGLFVLEYEYDQIPTNPNERNAFIAIDDTDSFPYDAFDLDINANPFLDETQFIGGTVFGLDDLPEAGGASILRRAGIVTGSKFVPPLAAGTYTFYIQQTGPLNRYSLDLRVTETGKQSVLAYHVTNVSDPTLFASGPTIDNNGTLRFRPATDANGTATFDVTVQDDGGTENGGLDISAVQVGTITIAPVNDRPTFTTIQPPTIVQGSGPQSVAGFISSFDPGPDDESSQIRISARITNFDNPEFFDANPIIDADGTLFYTARPDITGSVSFDVTVTDSGGGLGTSDSQRITITVDPKPIVEDLGDAPEPYPVTIDRDGARHIVGDVFLGATATSESDGQPSEAADADAADDGVTFITDVLAISDTETTAGLSIDASASGYLDAWADFNRDGDWDDVGEQFAASISLRPGPNTVPMRIPAGSVPGESFARFRFSSLGGLLPTGSASDGEVEDYRFTIVDAASSPDINVQLASSVAVVEVTQSNVTVRDNDVTQFTSPVASFHSIVVASPANDPAFTISGQNPVVITYASLDELRMGQSQRIDGRFVRSVVDTNGENPLFFVTDLPWQNLVRFSDVNNSGDVTAGDALRIINELGRRTFSDRETQVLHDPINIQVWPDAYFDQNGDGRVTTIDALRVINELARLRTIAAMELVSIDQVIESAGWMTDNADPVGPAVASLF